MRTTRRFRATAALGLVFVGLAVLAARPLALVGAVGIGSWLLATAWAANRSFRRVDRDHDVSYEVATPTNHVGSTVHASLAVSRSERASDGTMQTAVSGPPGLRLASGEDTSVLLAPGETTATTTIPLELPIAGRFTLPAPELELVDRFGLFTETIRRGPEPVVHALPRTPTVHIGKGGRPYGGAFGEHETDRAGPGVAVRELRQYVTGESAADIDWKSTARLGEPYVRETEGETDRRTVLVVDHRERTGRGPDGETPLEYAREVALAMTESAVETGDPLSLRAVGDEGVTATVPPGTDPTTYNRVRAALFDLEPTTAPVGMAESTKVGSRNRRAGLPSGLAGQLTGESPFDQTLRAYADGVDPYVRRVRDDPFVETVKRVRAELGGNAWLVLITTDDDPGRLRESVRLATRGGTHVLTFVIPTALFRDGGIVDLEETYDEYAAFEELRRELDGHPRATALELAPGDRLEAVLAARQDRRGEVSG